MTDAFKWAAGINQPKKWGYDRVPTEEEKDDSKFLSEVTNSNKCKTCGGEFVHFSPCAGQLGLEPKPRCQVCGEIGGKHLTWCLPGNREKLGLTSTPLTQVGSEDIQAAIRLENERREDERKKISKAQGRIILSGRI